MLRGDKELVEALKFLAWWWDWTDEYKKEIWQETCKEPRWSDYWKDFYRRSKEAYDEASKKD